MFDGCWSSTRGEGQQSMKYTLQLTALCWQRKVWGAHARTHAHTHCALNTHRLRHSQTHPTNRTTVQPWVRTSENPKVRKEKVGVCVRCLPSSRMKRRFNASRERRGHDLDLKYQLCTWRTFIPRSFLCSLNKNINSSLLCGSHLSWAELKDQRLSLCARKRANFSSNLELDPCQRALFPVNRKKIPGLWLDV